MLETEQLRVADEDAQGRPLPPRSGRSGAVTERGDGFAAASPQSRRYLKSVSGVYDVAGRAFELRRGPMTNP